MRSYVVPLLLLLTLACGKDEKDVVAEQEAKNIPEIAKQSETSEDAGAGGQSFKDGMLALCQSIDAVPRTLEPAEQQRQVAAWIGAHVTNPQVRELFSIIGDMPADQRPGMLSAAAAKAGLQNCALAER